MRFRRKPPPPTSPAPDAEPDEPDDLLVIDSEHVSGETVRKWLARQLDHRGGARLDAVAMQRFSIERMTRRGHGPERTTKHFQAPDVTLTGTLTVTDSDAFLDLLRRGIGRHKSFGYGMLTVRRA